jgi:hypothetical protein
MAKYQFKGSVEADEIKDAPAGKYQFNGPVQAEDNDTPADTATDAGNDSTTR